jgi:hypothetical protein
MKAPLMAGLFYCLQLCRLNFSLGLFRIEAA